MTSTDNYTCSPLTFILVGHAERQTCSTLTLLVMYACMATTWRLGKQMHDTLSCSPYKRAQDLQPACCTTITGRGSAGPGAGQVR